MDAHRLGRHADADSLYARFLDAKPGHAQALRLRGILARERGDAGASVRILRQAVEAAPDEAEPRSELGLSLIAAGDLEAATRSLRTAVELDSDSPRAVANLGAVLQFRGHLQEAIEYYGRYLELVPDDLEVRCNLANCLLDAGRGEEALSACDSALALAPGHPFVLATQGALLCGLERFSDGAEALEAAIREGPRDDMALVNLAVARRWSDRRAEEALRAACGINPDNARAVADLANLLIGSGRAAEAVDVCEVFLARHPGERLVTTSFAFALRDTGRADEARRILDYERLVQAAGIAVPEGFETLAGFNAGLAERLESDASLLMSPVSKATRGGGQTGELDFDGDAVLEAFRERVAEHVTAYAARCRQAGLGEHPVMISAPESWTLRAWGTVLESGGHQTPHMHPLGWLSGVYYTKLPPDMGEADPQAGWLEFGATPDRIRTASPPELRLIEPAEGLLVLFPSYFYHRTLPFVSATTRVSLAFDVVPGLAF